MEHHPVAARIAADVARRDPQRLSAMLTETVRLRALLPGGPIEAHGRENVAALLCALFADFDTVDVVESAGEHVADKLLIHYRVHVTQPAQRRFIQVLKPISVKIGDSFGEIRPYADGFRAEVEIDFTNPVIGQQSYAFDLNPERFRREVGRARTFGLMCDVARLWSAGYALGASFDNTVVFDEERLLNTEGLRYADECARHKVLDVIGDLALAGLPLLGAYRSVRGGHKLNHAVLTALLADRTAWRVVESEPAQRPRSRAELRSGMVGGMVAPAYGPDVS